jgi:hypothetical protein
MNRYRNLLASSIEVVVFLFAAFGGFLGKVAPPEETNPSYVVGIVSFLVLILLLIVSAFSRRPRGRNRRGAWIAAGIASFLIAVSSAFLYPRMLHKYTYSDSLEKPTEVRVHGSESGLTELAKEWVRENPLDANPAVLVRKFPPGQVWTPESIENARTVLLATYSTLVLSLATAIFCLLEVTTGSGNKQKP